MARGSQPVTSRSGSPILNIAVNSGPSRKCGLWARPRLDQTPEDEPGCVSEPRRYRPHGKCLGRCAPSAPSDPLSSGCTNGEEDRGGEDRSARKRLGNAKYIREEGHDAPQSANAEKVLSAAQTEAAHMPQWIATNPERPA